MVKLLLHCNIPIDTLNYLQTINENIDAVKHIVDVSNSTIANEISAVNTLLIVFTIVFGLVGVALGIYITWLEKKVSKMKSNIEMKEQTIISMAKTIEETDQKIQSDIGGLYAKLRKEETKTLLCRLVEEPLDITNLSDLLLARPLDDEGFPILKTAFMKLLDNEPEINDTSFIILNEKEQYSLIFFQHYLYNSTLDSDLRPEIEKNYNHCMDCAFRRDIIKSTNDFCEALSAIKASCDKVTLLATYLKALNNTKYKNLLDLKDTFQEKVVADLLVDAIDKCTKEGVYLELFGVEPSKASHHTEENN